MGKELREASTPTKLQPKCKQFETTKLQQHEDMTNETKIKTKTQGLTKTLYTTPLALVMYVLKKFMQNEIVLKLFEDRPIPNIGLKHKTHPKETEHIQARLNPHNHTKKTHLFTLKAKYLYCLRFN